MQYFVKKIIKNKIITDWFFYIDYHRDSTPRAKLLALANQNDCSLIEKQRHDTNIDECDSLDVDINELVIKPWCSRFCPRCYTYK